MATAYAEVDTPKDVCLTRMAVRLRTLVREGKKGLIVLPDNYHTLSESEQLTVEARAVDVAYARYVQEKTNGESAKAAREFAMRIAACSAPKFETPEGWTEDDGDFSDDEDEEDAKIADLCAKAEEAKAALKKVALAMFYRDRDE